MYKRLSTPFLPAYTLAKTFFIISFKPLTQTLFLCITLLLSFSAHATIVRFSTNLGDIDVNLYDELTPITVDNFLSYVNNQAYDNSYIHRSIPSFIIQGGGFTYTAETGIEAINEAASIANEPFFSNIRGTIAMAKIGNQPDSATSQWFFNIADNAANLDNQNGGFTVFGEVSFEHMDILDAIEDIDTFSSVPLRNYTTEDANNGVEATEDNFVIINNITIIDDTINTLGDVIPTATTAASSDGSGGGGGGSTGIFLITTLFGLCILRLRNAYKATA